MSTRTDAGAAALCLCLSRQYLPIEGQLAYHHGAEVGNPVVSQTSGSLSSDLEYLKAWLQSVFFFSLASEIICRVAHWQLCRFWLFCQTIAQYSKIEMNDLLKLHGKQ